MNEQVSTLYMFEKLIRYGVTKSYYNQKVTFNYGKRNLGKYESMV